MATKTHEYDEPDYGARAAPKSRVTPASAVVAPGRAVDMSTDMGDDVEDGATDDSDAAALNPV